MHLKFENLQFTGSFKGRGARNRLLDVEPGRGVIAMSAGNHAQGVAHHGAQLGLPTTIVMPETTPFVKVARTRDLGATVERAGSDVSESEEVARTLVDYLADRSNRSAAGLTYEAADKLLAEKDVEPALRQRFRACLETCDFVRFVPEASETGRRAEVLDDAADILEQLERAW